MKALILNDTSGWYHYGCSATSVALKAAIKSSKVLTTVTTVSILEVYKIKTFPDNYTGFLQQENYYKFIKGNEFIVNLLMNHDIIIINGEGTIHDTRKAALGLLYIAYIAKIHLNKHVEILNHSVYPKDNFSINNQLLLTENDQDAVNIYELVYKNIDFFSIREPISAKVMLEVLQKSSINIETVMSQIACDCMPLYIKNNYIRIKPKQQFAKKLLIAGSAAWAANIGDLTADIQENLEQLNITDGRGNYKNFSEIMEKFVVYLQYMANNGFEIVFLIGANAELENIAKDDQIFKYYLESKLLDLIKINKFKVYAALSLNQWLNCIETADLFVSGRFHHSLAAACLGTKFIAFNSNTPKVEGLCMLLNCVDNFINYHDPNLLTKLYDRTKVLLDKPLIFKAEETTANLADLALKNFSNLKKYNIL